MTKDAQIYVKAAAISVVAGGIFALILKRKAIQRAIWDYYTALRLNNLHPAIRKDAQKFIADAERQGIFLRITNDGHFRDFDKQAELYAKGRTMPGEIVTNAKPGQSFHNYGLALDVVEIKNGKALWDNPRWPQIAKIAAKYGFKWGGSWGDKPHFQKTFGYKWSDLLMKYNSGNFSKDGYIKLVA